ncbi:conjugal transfer protein TraG N-terminal domain-containing protein [Pseudomonas stutzeri]|uniref:conjugal transfer protein TraG N-terminal domain-containing protein n=1 Tax=Stutzerimonas stutzeri TaxID=316 RepID=UPI0015E45D0E|nr:conjugal transfer protein TraG N-terminal domain-containing protein [Stutzerimonas stutzeri]MBA1265292.1 conjugal transfer protein TraG [Stutzerimonas stutzeri]MCC8345175.1 conjugal transfer protein TraG N-terminal domain-containing protein [Stutzerimonas stutzeri]
MSMNIYTTGSGEFLEIILNASAMITGSGFSEDLARIGFLIGLVLLSFQAIWNGQGISFHKAGMLFVVYLLLYGPTTTAVIEDTTTNQVRIVDNLPIGPTFIGSVISTVAYNITKTSEQAFSTPSMTNYGLFSSLNTLAKVRDVLRNPLALDSFVNYRRNGGWDLPKSVNEYLTFCTLNPINLRNYTTIDELYRGAGLESVLAAPLISQSAYIYDGQPNGRLDSCTNIQPRLNAAIREAMMDVMGEILDKGFAAEKAAGKVTTQFELQAQIDQSIQSFAMSAKSAQGYTEMSLIQPIFGDARVNALNHWQEQNAALALRESLNHQEIQWAGKGDTFKHYMRPMIAFFEGLLYAMTPFMAFALVLGDKGMSILGKYMVLPLAVALWMPLLSIVNAFTLWYAGAEMQAIFDGYDATSQSFAMLQLLDIDHAISKALGVGGMLAASVPPLALFIVSGSAMVANSIMGQMTQGDKFRTEDVMPRTKDQAPIMDTSASYTSDQMTTGASVTGARATAPKLSVAAGADATVQSSHANAQQKISNLQETLQSGASQLSSTSAGRQQLSQIGDQLQTNLKLGESTNYNEAVRKLSSAGWSQDEIKAGSASGHLGGSLPMGLAGGRLEQSAKFQQMSSEQQQLTKEGVLQLQQVVDSNRSDTATFAAAEAFTQNNQAMEQVSNSDTIGRTLTEAKSAQATYTDTKASSQGWRSQQDLDIGQAAGKAIANSGLTKHAAALGIRELAGQNEQDYASIRNLMNSASVQQATTDNDERIIAASMLHMQQTGRMGELVDSQFSPFDFKVDSGNSNELAGLKGAAPDTSGMDDRFENARRGAAGAFLEMNDMNTSGYHSMKADGRDVIDVKDDANAAVVQEHYQTGLNNQPTDQPPVVDTFMSNPEPLTHQLSEMPQNFSNAGQGIKNAAQTTYRELQEAGEKYRESSKPRSPTSID